MKYILKFDSQYEAADEYTTWLANNTNSEKYVHVAQVGGPTGYNWLVDIQYFRLDTGGAIKGGETNK